MGALLDMSLFPLPNAVEELSYVAIRDAWLEDYAARMGVQAADLDDNDPAVRVLETGAYRELLVRQRINDAVRRTYLTSAYGPGLDDLGADPLYQLPRLVVDPGDPQSNPPRPRIMEGDESYRARLSQAPAALSPAGPASAYRTLALRAHQGVVDVAVSSPAPCDVLVELLFNEALPANANAVAAVRGALSAADKRPVGDRVTVQAARRETATIILKVFVDEGPDLAAVQLVAERQVQSLLRPIAARVRSGQVLSAGGSKLWRGAAMIPGVVDVQETFSLGMTDPGAAWWPMTISVVAERYNA